MTPLPRLLAGPRRRLLALLVGVGLAQAAATLVSAVLVHHFFARLAAGATTDWILFGPIGGLILASAGLAGLRAAERVIAERMGHSYGNDIRLALFESLAAQSPRQIQRRSRGGTLLRFIGDVKGVRRWASLGLPRLVVGTVVGTGTLSALGFLNVWLALAAAAGFLGATGVLAWLSIRVEPALKESRRRQAQLAADISDRIGTIAVVQVFDQVRRERRRLDRQSQAWSAAMIVQAAGLAHLRAAAEFGAGLAAAFLLATGALLIGHGALTVPELIASLTLVGLISPAFKDLGRVLGYWRTAQVSLDKIRQFLGTPRMSERIRENGRTAPAFDTQTAAIAFEHVSVGTALRGFTAHCPAGRHIAIVGPNGAGKSTLLALVARLAEADAGTVRVGGHPVGDFPLPVLRRGIGAITPDLPLMRGSIARNLRYRWPRAPASAVDAVCGQCGVDEILRTQPRGERARVADGGFNLSFGERQRIAWARALLGNPGILLLDEADANLDPQSVARLAKIVDAFPGTVLNVTHQLTRVLAADEVWYVEAGRLQEQGPPHELLDHPSRTRQLFRRRLQEVG